MNIAQAETLLENTLDSIFVLKDGDTEKDLSNLHKATTAIGNHNGLGQQITNEMALSAAIVAMEAGNGISFYLDTFWGTFGDLVLKQGGQI